MMDDRQRIISAENLLDVRATRRQSFPSELFDEFAWDMLLHLFVELNKNQTVSEDLLFERAEVPKLIGRRWLNHLISDGLIEAQSDGGDVSMTAQTIANMRTFLDRASELHASTKPT